MFAFPRADDLHELVELMLFHGREQAAEAFAEQIEEIPGTIAEKATWSFRTALSRQPSEAEQAILLRLHEDDPTWFNVAQALLNCDECVCR